MSRKQLTSKQHAFLEYLADEVRRTHVWPTYREIVDHFGYKSPNSVTQNLQALEKKGYLSRDDAHGYRLIGQRGGLAGSGFTVQGKVAGGNLEVALSIEQITLRDLFPALSDTYALRMEQPVNGVDVAAGDLLLLENGEIEGGSMVAVLLDGEAAVCRLLRDGSVTRLQFSDGREATFANGHNTLRLLGRYAGHINRLGIYRLPERTSSSTVTLVDEVLIPNEVLVTN
jgi:repressor LexA